HDVIAVSIPCRYQSAVRGCHDIVKARPSCISYRPQGSATFAFITIDNAALNHIHHTFAIGGETAQRHLRINHPLGLEMPGSIENLNSAARVFADIDAAGVINSDAAGIREHSGTDSLAAKLQNFSRETAACLAARWQRALPI